jgi:hypothetical protein
MSKQSVAGALAAGLVVVSGLALAQQHNHGAHQHAEPTVADSRVAVTFPSQMRDHTLANMRDHLLALQEIQDALARGENDKAARVAEERLGMSSLTLHGAHDVAKFMPQGMQDAGTGMHRAASRFAIEAQNAGATGDLKPALSALAGLTGQCVGCHAGYRLK